MSLREARLAEVMVENERLRLELEQTRAERNRVGQQAAAIAHDFEILATMISGYSQLLLRKLGPDQAALRGNLKGIWNASEWGGTLARQLLAAHRNESVPAAVVNLNDVIAGLEPLLRLLLGESHQLELSLELGLGLVRVNTSQVERVLTDLVVNARDALTGPGGVTIATANVELAADAPAPAGDLRPGRYVRLSVSDVERGIDPAGRARLFTPHLTTEAAGRGNEPGLVTMHDIVKRNGGDVRVLSSAGWGTTFEVYLPLVEGFAVAEPAPGGGERGRADETVLVVEDEAQVRDLIRDVLTLHGYTVLAAADGSEALRVDAGHLGRIDLLIVDVVMPGTPAVELVRHVAARRPGVKTVYMSGYTDDLIRQHGLLRVGRDFLQKPFTVDELARKVREVLDSD